MGALKALAQMADMTTAGEGVENKGAMLAGLIRKAKKENPNIVLDADKGLSNSYYKRQAWEDTTSIDRKIDMHKKRNLAIPLTPNDIVQEGFRDVRNPRSRF